MCTRDEVFTFSDPVLFPSIPVTYIITMEGSDRYDNVLSEIHRYKPTRNVVIVHHKPLSDCARPKWVTKVSHDLWNNNITIAKRDVNIPMLVLEDDVQFLPAVYDYAEHIDNVIANDRCEVYSLGACSTFSYQSSSKDITILLGGASQAFLFSKSGRQRLVQEYSDDSSYKSDIITHVKYIGIPWLHDLEIYYMFNVLAPIRPCAVQRFPMTENQKEWNNAFIHLIFYLTDASNDGAAIFELCHALGCFGGYIPVLITVLVLIVHIIYVLKKINK